ncbi:MAG: energy-coupling factor ABC transporter permease [Phototrophicaceae bacterium]
MSFTFPAIHIPDGLLVGHVAFLGWLAVGLVLIVAWQQLRREASSTRVGLMGVLAAFVFAAQMLNFNVLGGTSGHLIGGALVAILLGPWAAVVVMSVVIGVQALVFQDGGLLVMGNNLLNMAVISPLVGYWLYQQITARTSSRAVAAMVAAWGSVMAATLAASVELAASGTSPLGVVLPAMLSVHVWIGVGEAAITVAAVLAFQRLYRNPQPAALRRAFSAGVLLALALVTFAPLASPFPDGLERVATDHGFLALAQAAPYQLIPDYAMPFVGNPALATIIAGALGVMIVLALSAGLGRLATHKI